jgi:hypothetical protein
MSMTFSFGNGATLRRLMRLQRVRNEDGLNRITQVVGRKYRRDLLLVPPWNVIARHLPPLLQDFATKMVVDGGGLRLRGGGKQPACAMRAVPMLPVARRPRNWRSAV